MIFDSIKIKNNIPVKYNEIELDYSDAKVIIIYGDNGVGKTELSRAFISSQNCFDDFRQVEFLDSNEEVVELPNNYEVFVYNEDCQKTKAFLLILPYEDF